MSRKEKQSRSWKRNINQSQRWEHVRWWVSCTDMRLLAGPRPHIFWIGIKPTSLYTIHSFIQSILFMLQVSFSGMAWPHLHIWIRKN